MNPRLMMLPSGYNALSSHDRSLVFTRLSVYLYTGIYDDFQMKVLETFAHAICVLNAHTVHVADVANTRRRLLELLRTETLPVTMYSKQTHLLLHALSACMYFGPASNGKLQRTST